jgi:hypothetical protein
MQLQQADLEDIFIQIMEGESHAGASQAGASQAGAPIR